MAPPLPQVAAAPVLIIPAEGKRPAPIAALFAPKGRFDAPRTSGPRAAPVFPARAVASPPPGAPVPTDAATALAAAMRIAVDIAGGADPARAAPEQDVSAPQAHSLAPPAPQDAATQDIPRQIALRIAHAAAGAAGTGRGTVEISLSPEELGRVRLRLHPSEGGLSVTITADRPETLDLMRRNIDLLAREFLEIGYQGARFDFAQGGPGADADPGAPDLAPAPAPALDAPPSDTGRPPQAVLLMLGDRLDIRL
ncbi:MAG: flagellar hook-length control protein FliK [Roseovarius sp.]|uniref:flagellar hook-length control protein FliK n=1 Tax=Roseovarius sp. TaxID=1486281 RepID=UPI00405871F0